MERTTTVQGAPPRGAEQRAEYDDQISTEDSRYQGVPPSYKPTQKPREDYYYEESSYRTTKKHGPPMDMLDNREGKHVSTSLVA